MKSIIALQIAAYWDGRPGHEKQTRGVLQELEKQVAVDIRDYPIDPCAKPGKWRQAATAPPADLIIGTGSHTHLPMLIHKWRCKGWAATCMTPMWLWRPFFDLCMVPWHDRPKAHRRILVTQGPPNPCIDAGNHDPDRVLVVIGGTDAKSHHWSTGRLKDQLHVVISHGPWTRWTVTSSPRTPKDTLDMLAALAAAHPQVQFFPFSQTPPGWIEAAYDRHGTVWATADSVSMVYEALSAGCRVGLLPVQWKRVSNKFQRGLDRLIDLQQIGTYDQFVQSRRLNTHPAALAEARRCADEIVNQLQARQST